MCAPSLWFHDGDYAKYGNRSNGILHQNWPTVSLCVMPLKIIRSISWQPAIMLRIYCVGEGGSCLKAASGGPLVQHSLVAMLRNGVKVVLRMKDSGKDGAYAGGTIPISTVGHIRRLLINTCLPYTDLVLVDPDKTRQLTENIMIIMRLVF